jgi:DNA (cytosine-5)-methyltransferase 1
LIAREARASVAAVSGRVVELFAGVGGFRLGLEPSGWRTVWANQWEPSTRVQHAFDCYVTRFGSVGAVNADIATVADDVPAHELLVAGFPCQDYSVARTLATAAGIEGRKGVLWWQIHRVLDRRRPTWVLLENVDRLLSSPARQRGRDFAIVLACLADLGYAAEWRVVNAADYGFPQRRRRVFLVARRTSAAAARRTDPATLLHHGVLGAALPSRLGSPTGLTLDTDVVAVSDGFGRGRSRTPFAAAGAMVAHRVATATAAPRYRGRRRTLGDVLIPDAEVPAGFVIDRGQLDRWRYLKGAKREARVAANGHAYRYAEGAVAFPDPLDAPSRTVLTGEGGTGPSRFKHVVAMGDGRLRRLTPVELERLNGFSDGWTDTGMSDRWRAFTMGNALVVGIVERIGRELAAAS